MIQGLTIGRIVWFTSLAGVVHPAIVRKVWNKTTGCVNLFVFQDHPTMYSSIEYNASPESTNTWRWPDRED